MWPHPSPPLLFHVLQYLHRYISLHLTTTIFLEATDLPPREDHCQLPFRSRTFRCRRLCPAAHDTRPATKRQRYHANNSPPLLLCSRSQCRHRLRLCSVSQTFVQPDIPRALLYISPLSLIQNWPRQKQVVIGGGNDNDNGRNDF